MARLRNIHTVLISFIHKHIFTQRFTLRWFLAVHHLELFSLDLSSKSKKSTISYEHSVCPLLLSFCLCIDPPPPSNTNHHRRRETEILNSPVLYSNLRSSQSSHSLSLSHRHVASSPKKKKKKKKKRWYTSLRCYGFMNTITDLPVLSFAHFSSPLFLLHISTITRFRAWLASIFIILVDEAGIRSRDWRTFARKICSNKWWDV